MKRICVFCGSRTGSRPAYVEAARELGGKIAGRSSDLVYGGGSIGLMGTLANAVLENGGRVFGVIPDFLEKAEVVHSGLTEIHIVSSMHERKALMSRLADGFIALPGGFGTLEELLEIITWAQLGIQRKPIGLLDVEGYFGPLLALIDRAVEEGFIRHKFRDLFAVHAKVDGLLEKLERWWLETPPPGEALDLEET